MCYRVYFYFVEFQGKHANHIYMKFGSWGESCSLKTAKDELLQQCHHLMMAIMMYTLIEAETRGS